MIIQKNKTLVIKEDGVRQIIWLDDANGPTFATNTGSDDFVLDPETTQLFDGDALVLDDGDLICVKAAKEDILEISCETVNQLTRIAWHIGNRHIPAQFLENNTFRILYDHVLQGMVVGLGARALRKKLPFSPERGAYSDSNISGGHPHAH